jgi:hypothetical protein
VLVGTLADENSGFEEVARNTDASFDSTADNGFPLDRVDAASSVLSDGGADTVGIGEDASVDLRAAR